MKIKISKALRKEINRQAGFKGKANKQQVIDWLESAHERSEITAYKSTANADYWRDKYRDLLRERDALQAELARVRKTCLTKLNRGGIVGRLSALAQIMGYKDFEEWLAAGRPQHMKPIPVKETSDDTNTSRTD